MSGSNLPTVYNFQRLSLHGQTRIILVGPVVINVANPLSTNGTMGASNTPAWLVLNIASGGFTLDGGGTVYGYVAAPAGTITVNVNAALSGGVDHFLPGRVTVHRYDERGNVTRTTAPDGTVTQSAYLRYANGKLSDLKTSESISGLFNDGQGGTVQRTLTTQSFYEDEDPATPPANDGLLRFESLRARTSPHYRARTTGGRCSYQGGYVGNDIGRAPRGPRFPPGVTAPCIRGVPPPATPRAMPAFMSPIRARAPSR